MQTPLSPSRNGPPFVAELRSGEPEAHGTLRVWNRFGLASGARALSLRILEAAPGPSPGFRNTACDEVLYVLEGAGSAFLDGHAFGVEAGTGIHLHPGVAIAFDNPGPGPLTVASARCPDPGASSTPEAPRTRPGPNSPPPAPGSVVRLGGRATEPAPGGRVYEVLLDAAGTGAPVTQFIGSIPPGRAPDHWHDYEEVLVVLDGCGRTWADGASAPVAPGSCIFLPRRQVHCMENLGDGPLRLLGVFYPSGSPAGSTVPAVR
jgi:mannose-6-phosphate isomerase-like protein (cupin superfamily)